MRAARFALRRPAAFRWVWAAAALGVGALIAAAPLSGSAALAAGAGLALASLGLPAVGLGAAVAFGPARAFLAAAGLSGAAADPGQIILGLALAGWLVRGALRREVTLPPLALYLPLALWIGVGLLSLFGAADWRDGLTEAAKWIEVGLVMAVAYAEIRRGRLAWLLAAILAAGLAQSAIGLWQHAFRGAGPESFRLPDGLYRAYGSFEQPNPFGGYLGLIWPVAAGLGLGLLAEMPRPGGGGISAKAGLGAAGLGLAALVLLLGLYASFSRGAWLGAAAAALALAAFWPRRLALGLGLTTAAVVGTGVLAAAGLLPAAVNARLAGGLDLIGLSDVRGVNITDANFALVERMAHWQAALGMIQARPWLGVGLGNFASAYPDYRLLNWPNSLGHAHNIYLHTWAETGLAGLAAYAAFWASAIALTVRRLRQASGWRRGLALGLLGAWVHLLSHQVVDNLHVNNIDLLLGVYLGILCAFDWMGNNPREQSADPGAAPAA